ncbi:MAG: pyridoxal-phosphate dependent enzyme [Bryobacterales bacterium]|nr:pyridoxal-phosphate dependent enzyme [Bryobacterales bacterium]
MAGTPQPILIIGDARLEQPASPVLFPDAALAEQLADLHATLEDFRARRGFGRAIAAPQMGWMRRCIAMNLGAGPVSLINPEIVWRSRDEFDVWDDCLSIPDRIVRVRRARSIDVRYRDEHGRERLWRRLPEDLSELLQPEIDHLDGIRMTSRAAGPDAVRPIVEHAALIAAARPRHRLRLEAIERAAHVIDPVFLNTPQYESDTLNRALGRRVLVKVETANPVRNFKGRGAEFFLAERAPGRCVTASAGNWGQALAYAGARRGVPVTVFASVHANPLKLQRMRDLGAEVRLAGEDFDAAKLAAKASAGGDFVEDGREPEIAEGAGTMACELLSGAPALDAVFIPLGNGAMLTGMARWLKAASPATRVIAVCAAGADAMKVSFEQQRIVEQPSIDTIADGIGVRVPVPEALADMRGLVDEIVTVKDSELLRAMRLVYEHLRLLIEPSAAAGLAAIAQPRAELAGARVATVLCGGNLTDEQVRDWIVP